MRRFGRIESVPYHRIRNPDALHALLDAVLLIEADVELPAVLRRIAGAACKLVNARYGALGVLDESGKSLAEFVTVGVDLATSMAIGHNPEGIGILGLLILDPRPIRLRDLTTHPNAVGFPPGHPPMRSFLGAPVRIHDQVFGNLYLAEKIDADEFTEEDEALATALAAAAAITVDNARLHSRVLTLSVAEDRERIARDLHDTVIQRLFATGLSLQTGITQVESIDVRRRIELAIDDLDETIRQVRTTIFSLEPVPAANRGVRDRVLEVCAHAERSLGAEPAVRFSGPIEQRVRRPLAAELVATLREALSNVARHAHASRVDVEITVDDELLLRVLDDGVGLDDATSRIGNGLTNMSARAKALGGTFAIHNRAEGGAEVNWQVPLH